MTKTATLVAVTVLAAGCTTFDLDMRFTKPNATIADNSRDEWECHRRTADEPQTPNPIVGGVADAVRVFVEAEQRERLMVGCMQALGYQPTTPQGWLKSVRPARSK